MPPIPAELQDASDDCYDTALEYENETDSTLSPLSASEAETEYEYDSGADTEHEVEFRPYLLREGQQVIDLAPQSSPSGELGVVQRHTGWNGQAASHHAASQQSAGHVVDTQQVMQEPRVIHVGDLPERRRVTLLSIALGALASVSGFVIAYEGLGEKFVKAYCT